MKISMKRYFLSTGVRVALPAAVIFSAAVFAIGGAHARGDIAAAARLDRAPASGTFSADKGKFKIAVNGQTLGTEEFEIRPNGDHWLAQGTTELKTAEGAATHVTSRLTMQPDGSPSAYNWSTEGAKKASADITFQGNVATIVLHVEGAKPFTQQFTFSTPQIVILDNNTYHQYEVLARLYDREKKGTQTFSVLVPQEMTPGSVTVESAGESSLGGAKYEELRVRTADLEVDLYLDSNRRLMRLVSPASNAEVVRE